MKTGKLIEYIMNLPNNIILSHLYLYQFSGLWKNFTFVDA